jgi:hypothetical protein
MSDITLNDFKKNLDSGKYKSIAGGRRGVGKIQGWDDATREQARKLVDKHFGAVGVVPATKAAKPAAPKAKAAAKPVAATATGKRRGRPPGSGKKQVAAQPTKAVAKPKAAQKIVAAAPVKRARRAQPSGEKSIGDMTLVVGSISEALRAIKMCRELTTKPADLDPEALAAGRILGSVVQALGQAVVPTLMSEGSGSEVASAPVATRRRGPRKQEETMPVNGLSNPSDETPGEEPAAGQAS